MSFISKLDPAIQSVCVDNASGRIQSISFVDGCNYTYEKRVELLEDVRKSAAPAYHRYYNSFRYYKNIFLHARRTTPSIFAKFGIGARKGTNGII